MLLTWKEIQLARHVPSLIYEVTHTITSYSRATCHHRLPSSGCVHDSDALQVWDLMQWIDQCYRQSLTFCRTITQSGKYCSISTPCSLARPAQLACGTFVYMPEVRQQQLVQSNAQHLHPLQASSVICVSSLKADTFCRHCCCQLCYYFHNMPLLQPRL